MFFPNPVEGNNYFPFSTRIIAHSEGKIMFNFLKK